MSPDKTSLKAVPTPRISPQIRERLYRRRYLAPNLVTLGNLFCGFLAIIYASSGREWNAAVAIALAILLDGLDGRVARRLNATSKFGVEFDSFSDLISFGLAPAMLMYHWSFQVKADEFGVFVCFVYAICAATRLARFNISTENLKGFQGLPTPGAAGVVAAVINFMPHVEQTRELVAASTVIMLGLGYLMVSNIPFLSIKTIKLSRKLPLPTTILIGALIALTWYSTDVAFLAISVGYALSGPWGLLAGRFFPQKKEEELS
jgi:CDP-diacylglycerol--serine O-phosphatidyltransferase